MDDVRIDLYKKPSQIGSRTEAGALVQQSVIGMLLALGCGLVTLTPVFGQAIGTVNFAGAGECPGQGQLVVTQDGGNLTVVFREYRKNKRPFLLTRKVPLGE